MDFFRLLEILASLILSYFMYSKALKNDRKKRQDEYNIQLMNEKLDNLYTPIYISYLTNFLTRKNFIIPNVDCGNISYYFDIFYNIDDILIKNIKYLPKEIKSIFIKSIFIEFHAYVLNRFTTEMSKNSNAGIITSNKIYEIHFNLLYNTYFKIYQTLMKDYKDLCHKLGLPTPLNKFK